MPLHAEGGECRPGTVTFNRAPLPQARLLLNYVTLQPISVRRAWLRGPVTCIASSGKIALDAAMRIAAECDRGRCTISVGPAKPARVRRRTEDRLCRQ
jgi:hypothetical protein